MSIKNMKINKTKLIASIFTIFILGLILFAGPAKAFILSLDIADGFESEVNKGELIKFIASLEIQSQDQYLPINSLMLKIGSKTCSFNLDGETLNGCEGVSIEKISGSFGRGEGYGYGYDNSFGYGYQYNFNYGYGYGYQNGMGETTLMYEITIDTEYFSPKTYNARLQADIGGKTYNSRVQEITIDLVEGEEYAEEEIVNVGENTTEIIVGEDSGNLQQVIIPSSIPSDKVIRLNLKPLLSSGSVTIPNDFTLTRQGTYDYSAEIPNGTIVTGGDDWDGKIILPTIKTNSKYSVSNGAVNVVVDLGGDIELTFNKAVKITIGGMAGKSAGWTRGEGAVTKITNVCEFENDNPTNINSNSPRECYANEGNDLVIWTYHFTEFVAYTPTATTGGGGSGGCWTTWECTDWSNCFNGMQTRICAKASNTCNKIYGYKPVEERTCISSEKELIELRDTLSDKDKETKGFLSRITGGVVGAVTSTTGMITILFLMALAGVFVVERTLRKRNSPKRKAKLTLFVLAEFLIINSAFFVYLTFQ